VQDKITKLCRRLVAEDDPHELRPVAFQLQCAIRERLERVRENAVVVALVDQMIDWQPFVGKRDREQRST
jgi:hypothetical protein